MKNFSTCSKINKCKQKIPIEINKVKMKNKTQNNSLIL